MLRILKTWARRLIRDVHAVYLAARDPGVPWYARILAIAVAGYALSPIDLIPDFIPVIGYLDDLIIVPLGIWLVVSLIPKEVMAEYRAKAIEVGQRPRSKIAAIVIIAIRIFCSGRAGLDRVCSLGQMIGALSIVAAHRRQVLPSGSVA
jgi:uncharacterized membrane protein YkvA (DUF1232 family)